MARIGHKKSRNGCSRCKERKVKCDERVPCGACVKERILCSLKAQSAYQTGDRPRPDEHTALVEGSAPDDASAMSRGTGLLSAPPTGSTLPPLAPAVWAIEDLVLMNHYTLLTSGTLPGASHQVWQCEVPREAATYPFLMHQILAISAFHLGRTRPSEAKSHLFRGLQHQQNAISGIKMEVSEVTDRNCHALFAASSLLFMGAFAASTPASCPDDWDAVDDLLNIFVLLRGVGVVLTSSKQYFNQGILGGFIRCDSPNRETKLLRSVLSRLDHAEKLLKASGIDHGTKGLSEKALCTLRETIIGASTTSPELNVAVLWPMHLTDEFLALAREQDPSAVLVIAHYALVVDAAGQEFWFMEGWGQRLVTQIAGQLSPAWRELIPLHIDCVAAPVNLRNKPY